MYPKKLLKKSIKKNGLEVKSQIFVKVIITLFYI
jgi:hypothetical protein